MPPDDRTDLGTGVVDRVAFLGECVDARLDFGLALGGAGRLAPGEGPEHGGGRNGPEHVQLPPVLVGEGRPSREQQGENEQDGKLAHERTPDMDRAKPNRCRVLPCLQRPRCRLRHERARLTG